MNRPRLEGGAGDDDAHDAVADAANSSALVDPRIPPGLTPEERRNAAEIRVLNAETQALLRAIPALLRARAAAEEEQRARIDATHDGADSVASFLFGLGHLPPWALTLAADAVWLLNADDSHGLDEGLRPLGRAVVDLPCGQILTCHVSVSGPCQALAA